MAGSAFLKKINGYWLVNFPQCGEKHDIATIAVKEEDMNLIPVMQAIVNEQIKAQFDETLKKSESTVQSVFSKMVKIYPTFWFDDAMCMVN